MTTLAVGASYKTTATEVLELLAVPRAELDAALHRLCGSPAIGETMLLSTCNRTEVYAIISGPTHQAAHVINHFFAQRAGMSISQVCGFVRSRYESEAVAHLCAVACGLDSMATGEEHIVAQLRSALRTARAAGTAGGMLSSVVDAAFRASKRARTETNIGSAAPSLLSAGLELGRAALGDLAGRRALLVGSGAIGTLAARALRKEGIEDLLVVNRTPANARRLAEAVGGTALAPDELAQGLAGCDVLVCSTGSPVPVVTAELLRAARSGADQRPLFCLDLAMPRDVEPACRDIDGVTLVALDVLGGVLSDHSAGSDLRAAWKIVADEAASFARSHRMAAAIPLISALHSRATSLVCDEVSRLHSRLPTLSPRERAETEAALNRVASKLLHTPITRIKELTTAVDGNRYAEAMSRLFDLEPQATVDTTEMSRP
ncbi:MAG: glutamyl-tRNA reductase [Pseudonocardiaceae bacterium]